ncbi:hypothetical protein [Curtobacterium sp. MCPF17_046]|uniref:hypothetical protein n=1 Tax=Curtobacterium sp. MCPF17_046 TaxID=2175663 RepID=UPI0015E8EA92|nr:hypothetical protein [Curtobacterium sp. MCPF17_046]
MEALMCRTSTERNQVTTVDGLAAVPCAQFVQGRWLAAGEEVELWWSQGGDHLACVFDGKRFQGETIRIQGISLWPRHDPSLADRSVDRRLPGRCSRQGK